MLVSVFWKLESPKLMLLERMLKNRLRKSWRSKMKTRVGQFLQTAANLTNNFHFKPRPTNSYRGVRRNTAKVRRKQYQKIFPERRKEWMVDRVVLINRDGD